MVQNGENLMFLQPEFDSFWDWKMKNVKSKEPLPTWLHSSAKPREQHMWNKWAVCMRKRLLCIHLKGVFRQTWPGWLPTQPCYKPLPLSNQKWCNADVLDTWSKKCSLCWWWLNGKNAFMSVFHCSTAASCSFHRSTLISMEIERGLALIYYY